MNSYGEYIEDAYEKNVKLQSFYSEDNLEEVNMENIENEEQICKKSKGNKTCNICMKSYKTQQNLKLHVQVRHTGIKYPCIWCV